MRWLCEWEFPFIVDDWIGQCADYSHSCCWYGGLQGDYSSISSTNKINSTLPNRAVTEQCLQIHRATSATVFYFDIKYLYYQHWTSNTSYNAMFAGLSCHSCNSIYDRRCGDPYDAYTTEIVDCEQVNTIRFGVGIFFILLSDIGEHFKTWRPPSIFCLMSWLLLNWWYFCHRSGGSWPMWTELRALQHFVERQCRQVQCADF